MHKSPDCYARELRISQTFVNAADVRVWQVAACKAAVQVKLLFVARVRVWAQAARRIASCFKAAFAIATLQLPIIMSANANVSSVIGIRVRMLLTLELELLEL